MMLRRGLMIICVAVCAIDAHAGNRMIPVPQVTIYPGEPVSLRAISMRSFNFPAAAEATYVSDPAQLAGRFARRTLVAGRPIAFSHLRGEEKIKPGRTAPAIYSDGGLVISGQLVPLQAGEAGQQIEARNPDSGQTVMAIIQDDGSLRVAGP